MASISFLISSSGLTRLYLPVPGIPRNFCSLNISSMKVYLKWLNQIPLVWSAVRFFQFILGVSPLILDLIFTRTRHLLCNFRKIIQIMTSLSYMSFVFLNIKNQYNLSFFYFQIISLRFTSRDPHIC